MSAEHERLSSLLAPHYEVEGELGRGGMAVVYAARDVKHNRRVAIKVLGAEASAAVGVERFLRETSVVAHLQHPHIVPLLDSGRVDDQPYYVMPLIAGESLRARLSRERQLPPADVLAIARDVASALDYAHGQGIIHRDVKPENILLTSEGAMVADFGIAVAVAAAGDERLTESGLIVGTPTYMSPEQAVGDRSLDGRSDLYSLGCVIYEAFAGHAPFTGATPRELIARHLTDAVPPLRPARPDLAPAVEAVLVRALAKTPADRQRSAGAMVQELTASLTGEIRAEAPRRARTRRVATGLVLVAAVVTVALVLRSRVGYAFEAQGWLLLADIDNRTGDSLFDEALTSALAVSLEQSRFANVLPRQVVNRTLRAMGIGDTARLTPAVAREVAQRSNGAAIVFPAIERSGAGYELTLRVEATATQRDLVVQQATAATRDAILPTLGALAERIRRELGEKLRNAPAPVALEFATTSSLDALRAWSAGQRYFRSGKYDAAVVAYQEALALDSNFALAHKSLGVTFYWLNNRSDGDLHLNRALALSSRLTERERLVVAADVANWRNRTDEAILWYGRVLDLYPDDRITRNNMAYALMRGQRYRESVTEYERILEGDSANFSAHINLATSLCSLGRDAEALPHYAHAFALQPAQLKTSNLNHEYAMAFADAGFPDSASRLLEMLATGDALQRAQRWRSLGLLDLRRGAGDSALRHFREALALSKEVGNPTTLIRNHLYLARTLVWMERTQEALRELDAVTPLLRPPRIEPTWIATAADVAAAVGDRLRTATLSRMTASRADMGNANDRADANRVRAEAALLTGSADSAIVAAEAAVAAQGESGSLNVLARAYERAGRLSDARTKFVESARQPLGGGEGTFYSLASLSDASRISLQLGDTVAARQWATALLQRWSTVEGAFPARARVAALLASLTR